MWSDYQQPDPYRGPPGQGAIRPPSSTVFVGNVPYDVTEQMLTEILSEVGPIKSLRLVNDKDSGKPKGYGFCEYYDQQTAESAVRNLNNHEISGRSLRVDFADEHVADRKERKDAGPRPPMGGFMGPPPGTKQIGPGAANAAAQLMAGMLGGGPPGPGQDCINSTIAGMTPMQLFEIMSQMKNLIQQNQQSARQILVQNPQLTKALFQAQILLGMVKMPNAPPPPPQAAQPQPLQLPQQLPGPLGISGAPQQPPLMGVAPPMQPGVPPQYPGAATAPVGLPGQQPLQPFGQVPQAPYSMAAPLQPLQPGLQQPQQQPQPQQPALMMLGPQGVQPLVVEPSSQALQYGGLPQSQPLLQQAPLRPAPAPAAAPPAQQPQPQPQPQAQPQAQPQGAAAMPVEQQQALLHTLLTLTPEQINQLPQEQKMQAIQIITLFRGQQQQQPQQPQQQQ